MKLFKEFLKTSIRIKRWTKKRTKEVYDMPMEKLAVGTVAVVVPGGMLISGVYVAANEIREKYLNYVNEQEKNQKSVDSFVTWFGNNYEEYFGEKKTQVVNTMNESFDTSIKTIRSIGDYSYTLSKKVTSFFK